MWPAGDQRSSECDPPDMETPHTHLHLHLTTGDGVTHIDPQGKLLLTLTEEQPPLLLSSLVSGSVFNCFNKYKLPGTYLVYRSLPQFIIFYVKLRAATAMYVFVSLCGGVVEADSTVE